MVPCSSVGSSATRLTCARSEPQLHRGEVEPIHRDLPCRGQEQTLEQQRQRGFSGPRPAHHPRELTRRNLQVYVGQDVATLGAVAKGHLLEADKPPQSRQGQERLSGVLFRRQGLALGQFTHVAAQLHHPWPGAREPQHRQAHQAHQALQGHELADGHLPAQDEVSPHTRRHRRRRPGTWSA